MAYIALPTRDSSFLLLANAAPRLPRSAGVTASASCSSLDGAPVRPMRMRASRLCGAHLSSNFHPRGRRVFAAVEGSVTVEEPAVSTASEESEEETASAEAAAAPAGEGTEPSDAPAKKLQRSNTIRRQAAGAKREITVTTEQLVVGAVFTGKVRAVQSYGAFVDIGAFTDGLVHISQLSSGYVKEVSDVVTVGQEVSVTVVELNEKSGRIALSMRDKESEAEEEALRAGGESGVQGDGSGKPMNRGKIAGRGGGTARSSSRSNDDKKATKLKKGQELKGTVKNIIRNGAFIAFAEEGEEGFLRGSEIREGGENVAVDSLVTVGQEVTVRVLKIERGKAALTMKPQVDMTSINDSLNTNVGAGGASNPFATFFRSANLVPAAAPAASVDAEEESAAPAVEEEPPTASVDAQVDAAGPALEETSAVQETAAVEEVSKTEDPPAPALSETPAGSVDAQVEAGGSSVDEETPAPALEETTAMLETPAVEEVTQTADTPTPAVAEPPAVEETSSPEAAQTEEAPVAAEESTDDSSKAEEPRSLSLGEIAEGIGGAVAEVEKVVETAADLLNVGDKGDGGASEATGAPSSEETESRAEEAQPVEAANGQAAVEATPEPEIVPEAATPTPVLDESRAESAPVVEEPKAEAATPVAEEAKAAAVPSGPTAAQVKELREKSGAGMMECKKALVACGNDVSKASEYLRKKGLAGAEKKSSRIAAEGRVGSYVHDGRMGVLIELNCETDFVSRGTQFKELVADMGMQVVACPDVRYVSVDDVPAEFVQKEREIEMGKEDLASKPPQIREKIVEGRIAKRLAELALLEQAYIRDDKMPVKDLVKETTAKLGEKVQIRRFVRFNLGEGLQKKSSDFAAEVAAQTAAKADVKPAGEAPPKVEEAKKEDEVLSPKVAVSAATVKELRDATGAGMMDCKKALAACENDVSKATDYLRKKGLASADKKSGRVASEGLIGSYIHDGRIGVLVEVNSETDFVARSAQFKELVANIGMQVAACPQVQYVSVDEIPASFVEKEKEIEMGKEDLGKRPEAVRSKIVEGRVAKTLNELALLEQPYIRDDKLLVKDYVKQSVAALGENIQVRRFARFNLGEGIEKRSTDFAAEVAAQTGSKA